MNTSPLPYDAPHSNLFTVCACVFRLAKLIETRMSD